MDEYEFDFPTALELAGVDRPVVARCLASEGSVGVVSEVMGRDERRDWLPDGSYSPRIVRHVVDITVLLDSDQLHLVAEDAGEWLKEQAYEDAEAA